MSENYFDIMTSNLMDDQESKKNALGLDSKKPTKKSHLHITIPKTSMDKLKAKAKERHLSVSVMVQILIDEYC